MNLNVFRYKIELTLPKSLLPWLCSSLGLSDLCSAQLTVGFIFTTKLDSLSLYTGVADHRLYSLSLSLDLVMLCNVILPAD